MSGWTTPSDIAAKVRRRWDDGSLLTAWATHAPFPEIDLPIRGPRAGEIGDALGAVQEWAAALESGSRGGRHYELSFVEVGGRSIGRNRLPSRARLTSYDQAWALLGVTTEVARYEGLLEQAGDTPAVRAWATDHPHRARSVAGEWQQMVAAFHWLDGARGSGRHLREITAPGVDTKFVERHRAVLAQLLGVSRSATGFVADLGLLAKPDQLRLRFDDGFLGLPVGVSEATFRAGELARCRVAVPSALIVENEATFLSVPVPSGGVVIWGKGFEVDRAGALPWLQNAAVRYWGDLDTHGFAILDRLRAWLPRTDAVLMDRDTLLAHRDRWGSEPSPTAASLTRLRPPEAELYADLVTDRYGDSLRLEQERIDWSWVEARLTTD